MPISATALAKVRARAAQMRTDTGLIYRYAGLSEVDPVTLQVTSNTQTKIWQGPANCSLSIPSGQLAVGEGNIAQSQLGATIDPSVLDVRVDDVFCVLTSNDPNLAGTAWRIIGVKHGGIFAAAVSLSCVGMTRSAYWTGQEQP